MKRIFATIISILFLSGIVFFYLMPPKKETIETESPYLMHTCNKDKKKVLIFSSKGGGGHISVMNALHEYLDEEFCTGHSFIFSEVLSKIDPAQWVSNKSNGEDVYNFFLKKKWFQTINMMYNFGSWYYVWRKNSIERLLEEHIKKNKPDLIVSVIPLVNNMILNVAKKLDIPFLLIPTDLDGTMALNGIDNPDYEKFHLALSYDIEKIRKIVDEHNIDEKYITHVGFPVKNVFFKPANIKAIKADFNVPEDKPTILLLMGAQGSQDLLKFTRELTKLNMPVHLLIAIGRSEDLRPQLEKLPFPKHVTKTVIGFTNRMPDLMRISDIFVTKSGGVSFNEGLYAHLPMILDDTSGVLNWEKLNHTLVQDYNLGTIVKRYFRLPAIVTELLSNKKKLEEIKKNFAQFTVKNPEQEIRLLIKQILKSNENRGTESSPALLTNEVD